MKTINYEWNRDSNLNFDIEEDLTSATSGLSTRNNLQLARRIFHMANGLGIAVLYYFSLSHEQMIHLLGTVACLIYVTEQIRINYPEFSNKLLPMTKFIIRAEEQLKESAMIPYLIAVLLTIITFPKPIAICAIATLAIADPLSAIIGIKFGKHKIVPHKSIEGSLAFFISTLLISIFTLLSFTSSGLGMVILISVLLATFASGFEMLPIKIDDNLTIPLFTAFTLWILTSAFGIFFYS